MHVSFVLWVGLFLTIVTTISCHRASCSGKYKCKRKNRFTRRPICISKELLCDGNSDCPLADDEEECITSCPLLDRPADGNVFHTGLEKGDIIVYSCNGGYSLSFNNTRNCLINGSWDGTRPTCNITVNYGDVCVEPCLGASQTCKLTFPGDSVDKCRCIIGYSHNPDTNACVNNCTTYGSTYQWFEYQHLSGYNDRILYNKTVSTCQTACDMETDFVCRSLDFTLADGQCDLSRETASTVPANKVRKNDNRYDHYARDCQ